MRELNLKSSPHSAVQDHCLLGETPVTPGILEMNLIGYLETSGNGRPFTRHHVAE